jgi:hypothetical protein
MAATPTFDYLTITPSDPKSNGKPWNVKYIVKSRDINFTTDVNEYVTFKKILESSKKYISNILNRTHSDMKKPQVDSSIITSIQIYSDSITIRAVFGRTLNQINLPIRNNQIKPTKILFSTISESFQADVINFIEAVDAATITS